LSRECPGGDAAGSRRQPFSVHGAASMAVLFCGSAGCVSDSGSPPSPTATAVTPAVAVTAADLVGNWGLASYRQDADRARTEVQAKAACNNPYKITPGPNAGVLMYLADQTELSELFLKTAGDGRVFLGPKGPTGVGKDRLVESFDNGVLITKFVNSSAAARYGILLFVRCGKKA
jgi:hypothetical protein